MGHLFPGAGQPAATGAPQNQALESLTLSEYREAVVTAIREEDQDSARIAELLKSVAPWAEWPERFRQVLMATLTEEGNRMEAHKARVLRGQLFRDVDPGWPPLLPSTLPPADRCLVERLRMDLLGRAPLGYGQRLLVDLRTARTED